MAEVSNLEIKLTSTATGVADSFEKVKNNLKKLQWWLEDSNKKINETIGTMERAKSVIDQTATSLNRLAKVNLTNLENVSTTLTEIKKSLDFGEGTKGIQQVKESLTGIPANVEAVSGSFKILSQHSETASKELSATSDTLSKVKKDLEATVDPLKATTRGIEDISDVGEHAFIDIADGIKTIKAEMSGAKDLLKGYKAKFKGLEGLAPVVGKIETAFTNLSGEMKFAAVAGDITERQYESFRKTMDALLGAVSLAPNAIKVLTEQMQLAARTSGEIDDGLKRIKAEMSGAKDLLKGYKAKFKGLEGLAPVVGKIETAFTNLSGEMKFAAAAGDITENQYESFRKTMDALLGAVSLAPNEIKVLSDHMKLVAETSDVATAEIAELSKMAKSVDFPTDTLESANTSLQDMIKAIKNAPPELSKMKQHTEAVGATFASLKTTLVGQRAAIEQAISEAPMQRLKESISTLKSGISDLQEIAIKPTQVNLQYETADEANKAIEEIRQSLEGLDGMVFEPKLVFDSTTGKIDLAGEIRQVSEEVSKSISFFSIFGAVVTATETLFSKFGSSAMRAFGILKSAGQGALSVMRQIKFAFFDKQGAALRLAGAVGRVTGTFTGLTAILRRFGRDSKGAQNFFLNLPHVLRRIIYFRLVNTLFRNFLTSIREGTRSLAQFSSEFNASMSLMYTRSHMLSNVMGATLSPVVQALIPLWIQLSNAIIRAANAIQQFLSAITGRGYWYRAIELAHDYTGSLEDAGAAARAATADFTAGFDELNVIADRAGAGAGADAGAGLEDMFERVEIDPWWEDFALTIRAFIDEFLDWIIPIGRAIRDAFMDAWRIVGPDFLDALRGALRSLWDSIRAFGDALRFAFESPSGLLMFYELMRLGESLLNLVTAISDAWREAWVYGEYDGRRVLMRIMDMVGAVARSFRVIVDALADTFASDIGVLFFENLNRAIYYTASAVMTIANSFTIAALSVYDAYAGVTRIQRLTDAIVLTASTLLGIWGDIARDIAYVFSTETGVDFWKNILDFAAETVLAINDIAQAFRDAWNDGNAGRELVDTLVGAFGEIARFGYEIAKSFREAWNTSERGQGIMSTILRIFTDVFGVVKNIAGGLADAWGDETTNIGVRIWGTILGLVEGVLERVASVAERIREWSANADYAAFLEFVNGLLEIKASILLGIIDGIIAVGTAIVNALGEGTGARILENILRIVDNIVQAFVNWAENTKFFDILASALEFVTGWLAEGNRAVNLLSAALRLLVGIKVVKFFAGVIAGISAMVIKITSSKVSLALFKVALTTLTGKKGLVAFTTALTRAKKQGMTPFMGGLRGIKVAIKSTNIYSKAFAGKKGVGAISVAAKGVVSKGGGLGLLKAGLAALGPKGWIVGGVIAGGVLIYQQFFKIGDEARALADAVEEMGKRQVATFDSFNESAERHEMRMNDIITLWGDDEGLAGVAGYTADKISGFAGRLGELSAGELADFQNSLFRLNTYFTDAGNEHIPAMNLALAEQLNELGLLEEAMELYIGAARYQDEINTLFDRQRQLLGHVGEHASEAALQFLEMRSGVDEFGNLVKATDDLRIALQGAGKYGSEFAEALLGQHEAAEKVEYIQNKLTEGLCSHARERRVLESALQDALTIYEEYEGKIQDLINEHGYWEDAIEYNQQALGELESEIININDIIDLHVDTLEVVTRRQRDLFAEMGEAVTYYERVAGNALRGVTTEFDEAGESIGNTGQQIIDSFQAQSQALRDHGENMGVLSKVLSESVMNELKAMPDGGAEVMAALRAELEDGMLDYEAINAAAREAAMAPTMAMAQQYLIYSGVPVEAVGEMMDEIAYKVRYDDDFYNSFKESGLEAIQHLVYGISSGEAIDAANLAVGDLMLGLATGMGEGVEKAKPYAGEAGLELMNTILDNMGSAADVSSPSGVTKDMAYKGLGGGIIEGLEQATDPSVTAAEMYMTAVVDSMSYGLYDFKQNTGELFMALADDTISALDPIPDWFSNDIISPMESRLKDLETASTTGHQRQVKSIKDTWTPLEGFFDNMADAIAGSFKDLERELPRPLEAANNEIRNRIFNDLAQWIQTNVTNRIGEHFNTARSNIIKHMQNANQEVRNRIFNGLAAWFQTDVTNRIGEHFNNLRGRIISYMQAANQEIRSRIFNDLASWFQTNVTNRIGEHFNALRANIIRYMNDANTEIRQRIFNDLANWFQTDVTLPIARHFEQLKRDIEREMQQAHDAVRRIWMGKADWFLSDVTQPIARHFEQLRQDIEREMQQAHDNVQNIWRGMAGWFESDVTTPLRTGFVGLANDIISEFERAAVGARTAWSTGWGGGSVSAWFDTNVFNPLRTSFEELSTSIVNTFETAAEGARASWTTWQGQTLGAWFATFVTGPILTALSTWGGTTPRQWYNTNVIVPIQEAWRSWSGQTPRVWITNNVTNEIVDAFRNMAREISDIISAIDVPGGRSLVADVHETGDEKTIVIAPLDMSLLSAMLPISSAQKVIVHTAENAFEDNEYEGSVESLLERILYAIEDAGDSSDARDDVKTALLQMIADKEMSVNMSDSYIANSLERTRLHRGADPYANHLLLGGV